jgi:SPP1 family predicted phage head-tail adaptor
LPAAGTLDHVAKIWRRTVTRDDVGGEIETWAIWRTIKVGKRDISADERFRANQEIASDTSVFTAHWLAGLTVQDRMEVDEKMYDIIAIAELGRRSGLEITATAQVT